MGLIDQIRSDVLKMTSDTRDFPVNIEMHSPDGNTISITAIHTKHHLNVTSDGNIINSKNASVAFSEALLVAPYPCRNSKQEVDLRDHKVYAADNTGIVKKYIVQSCYPDEMIGLIVLILEDLEE